MCVDKSMSTNVYSSISLQVCYQAQVHPASPCSTLSREQVERVREAIHHVCSTAVSKNAEKAELPESWLFHSRWGKKKEAKLGGRKISFETVGGRTTAIVLSVQKKGANSVTAPLKSLKRKAGERQEGEGEGEEHSSSTTITTTTVKRVKREVQAVARGKRTRGTVVETEEVTKEVVEEDMDEQATAAAMETSTTITRRKVKVKQSDTILDKKEILNADKRKRKSNSIRMSPRLAKNYVAEVASTARKRVGERVGSDTEARKRRRRVKD